MKANELQVIRTAGENDFLLMDTGEETGKISFADAALVLRPGVNLFDNFDFQIWQKYPDGVFEGVPNGTRIADRYKFTSSNGDQKNVIKRVDGGGILNESGPNIALRYYMENAGDLNGKVLTLSALKKRSSGDIYMATATFTPDYLSEKSEIFYNFSLSATGSNQSQIRWINTGETLLRVKLEPGSRQTLAHQDAAGNWVPNDPSPNKALELLKCQRYYRKDTKYLCGVQDTDGWVLYHMDFERMRTRPAITASVMETDASGTLSARRTSESDALFSILGGKNSGDSVYWYGTIEMDAEL